LWHDFHHYVSDSSAVHGLPAGGGTQARATNTTKNTTAQDETMSTDGIIGERALYQGLDICVFNQRQGTYRIQVLDGADGFSSTCAGYTPEGIRERA
jgi:hypothetical protein